MSNLTNKVLQEISDLTKNMDVLVKELRSDREEQNKSLNPVDKLTQNLTKFEEQKIKRDEEFSSSQEVLFKNLTDSIQKSFENRDSKLLSDLNKSLSLDIEKAFSDFPNKVAQVKSNDVSSKNLTSDIIDQIASKTAEKTPGLKTGGEVTKKGIAVVGENGPELVELAKGDKVKTPEQQLLNENAEKNRKAREIVNQDTEKLILSEKQKLSEKENVLNSSGIKVPQKDIEVKRESLQKEFPGISKSELDRKIEFFVESYRDSMTLEDIQKLNTKENPKTQESLDNTTPGTPRKIKDLENLEDRRDTKKEGVFSKTKEEVKNIFSEAKKSYEVEKQNLTDSLKTLKNESNKTTGSNEEKKVAPKNQIKVETIRGDLMKLSESTSKVENTQNKEISTPSEATVPSQTREGSQQQTKKDEPGKPSETKVQTKKTGITPSETSSKDLSTDMKEIKGLLAAIYKALSGPLSISSDIPFRPNSNNF
jgi:SLT domain-containing protein